MARKFLYFVAGLTFLVILGAFVYRVYGEDLMEIAFVPDTEFEQQAVLEDNVYAEKSMWLARPELTKNNPALWLPTGFEEGESPISEKSRAAVFFIHPTSFTKRDRWNAPLDDKESQALARIFLRGQASAFNQIGDVWAPRYRQATIGAFLTEKPEGQMALDAAYQDVLIAFDYFIEHIPENQPIVLAGHSQGSLHLTNLLKDRVAGTPLANRIVAAYVVGWPVSVDADVPAMGLTVCEAPDQAKCILGWESFAEPAEYGRIIEVYDTTIGFNGEPRKDTKLLCTNPINGDLRSEAKAEMNLGTLVPNNELSDATLVAGAVPARCDDRGFLLIGDPPDLGPYTLPGNNYHVYDYSLFWSNIRADVLRRMQTFLAR
ncbi:DUF3089 domain-containing protein [Parasphingorhabdus halotolerans]|uniref:DUF3089 domain-containing protein n=1 Tax=Parasphingorhabdus halotolerans TaxID=2725558 RepID=A0A6H2DQZ8_9SPHN|nr:DUF3089 domain-containing protein [Parasphingorhabdus halotolerans]QJB70628.1 DUF3089 domain-containing protein [Parasphingorhabdus halotolerans]